MNRAVQQRLQGKPADVGPLEKSLQENVQSRRAALELLFRNPDVQARVVDSRNTQRFRRRMITDPREAAMYLAQQLRSDEVGVGLELARLREQTLARYRAGELPVDVMTSLLGPGWDIRPPVPMPSLRRQI
jgi:hypothetical protein